MIKTVRGLVPSQACVDNLLYGCNLLALFITGLMLLLIYNEKDTFSPSRGKMP